MSETERTAEDVAKERRARVAFFRSFLYCGGALTLDDWRSLAQEDRSALVEAASQVEAGRAARVAEAFELRAEVARAEVARDQALERAGRQVLERGG